MRREYQVSKTKTNQMSMVVSQKLPGLMRRFQAGDHAGVAAELVALAKDAPNDGRVFDMLSTAQAMLAQRELAVSNARKALELLGDQPQVVARCASVLQRAGEYDESLTHIERALYRDAKNPMLIKLKVTLLTDLGKQKQALRTLEGFKKTVGLPDDVNGKMGLALLASRLSPDVIDASVAIGEMEPLLADPRCADGFRKAGAFHLGRLHEHLGEYDAAFKAYSLGKSVNKPSWDPDAHSARINQLIECWTNGSDIPHASVDGSNLVFIVGMMRSGTSLTEQMVSQCQGIVPGDELDIVDDAVARIEQSTVRVYAASRDRYTEQAVEEAATRALAAYKTRFKGAIGTDKQPENFCHIPIIVRLFPGCKIIHCTRDPMDCCVSNFVQSFAHGHPQTHDLAWLGQYHRDYQRVMDTWRSLPEITMLEVAYEELVADPETQTKRLAEYIGVEWTADMLRFYESKRIVKTASREQIRSAINTRSVGRHKRFFDHLAPLRKALQVSSS